MTTIFQDNLNISPDNINWRGAVAAPFRAKKNALAALNLASHNCPLCRSPRDRKDVFKIVKKASRWFLIVGQAA
jgi:hypothetical protein